MEETILELSLFSKDSQSGNILFDTQGLNEDIYFCQFGPREKS